MIAKTRSKQDSQNKI